MSQLRLDPLTGRWVVISAERGERPSALAPRSLPVEAFPERPCPFCPSHEDSPVNYEQADGDGWHVRVVPNRYPAFDGSQPMAVTNLGPVFTQAPGSGIHEVLILSPDHATTWADLDDTGAERVMRAMAARMADHASTPGLRYSQGIVNSGREAGASLEHPHGQLLGMPFVPREITDEQAGFARFAGNCLLCTTLEAEESAGHRIVLSEDDTVVVAPFWSGTPYEMLVLPRAHGTHLYEATDETLSGVGRTISRALEAMRDAIGDVAYNVVFHSAPYKAAGDFHWHAHILPKVATRAGFELGTGVLINVVPPEDAAATLRATSAAHVAAAS